MKNILMVCIGNICRSPLAEGVLKKISEENALNLNVESAGLGALVNYPADPFALEVAQKNGIDITSHRARQLSFEILQNSDLVLVMETVHQQQIGCLFPSVYGKVHRLGKWGNFDVADPYKKSYHHFEDTYALIEKGLQQWQQKLWSKNV